MCTYTCTLLSPGMEKSEVNTWNSLRPAHCYRFKKNLLSCEFKPNQTYLRSDHPPPQWYVHVKSAVQQQLRHSGPCQPIWWLSKRSCLPSLALLIFTPLMLESFASTTASSPAEFVYHPHLCGSQDASFSLLLYLLLSSLLVLLIHLILLQALTFTRLSLKQTCDLVWFHLAVLNLHNLR